MILTCPECATSYFVDDDRIPPAGRTVKCSSCGNRWKALPEGEAEPDFSGPAPAVAPAVLDIAAAAPDPSEDIEFVPGPMRPPRKAKAKGGSRGVAVGVAVIGVLAAAVAGLVAFRAQVAGTVPGAAPLFAAVGLPVNTLGLAFEGVAWKPVLLAGRPVMSVTGAIRNTTKAAISSPPVRVSLLDDKKTALVSYDLAITNAKVPPGGLRYFAWNLPDPPAGAHGLEIRFNPGAKAAAAAPEAHAPPAPAEAQALPPDSPDALTKHE